MEDMSFLGTAIISMNLALVFYSLGTWGERVQKILKPWHIAFFLLGLMADSFGTAVMTDMGEGKMDLLHGITGMLALVLMGLYMLCGLFARSGKEVIRQSRVLANLVFSCGRFG